jgi:DUF1680 family protein
MNDKSSSYKRFKAIPFHQVAMDDQFWKPRIDNNRSISIPYQFHQLNTSGVLDNFRRVSGQKDGEYTGSFWMDSDAYKWLEAASYSIVTFPDPQINAWIDEVIALIGKAQEGDGYLNTYFQLVEPDKKFTNLGMCHELYCAGHLFQAAVAHYTVTGQKNLLHIACRLADCVDAKFGVGKETGIPGHEEIEMGLIELYRVTGEKRYLNLASYFIEGRGNPNSRLRAELANLNKIAGKLGIPGQINERFFGTYENYDGSYAQDHLPVREQIAVVGHAVRAMYLYCGMADLAAETGDQSLIKAMERLWQNVTTRRMYITGGIGPTKENEGFTRDFDLPNDTAYAETCASVGMIMWNHRMSQLTGEGMYGDIIEKVLYNGFLSGVSLDGCRFFYDNPLQSDGTRHRQGWFWCACCPPNVSRLLASLGNYIYLQAEDGIVVNLYIQSKVDTNLPDGEEIILRQKSDFPWDGRIQFTVGIHAQSEFALYLRIPAWCRNFKIEINGEIAEMTFENGYAKIRRKWQPNDILGLSLDMPVERIVAHPAVHQDLGKIALQRGPLVYCLEEVDNRIPVDQVILPADAVLTAKYQADILEGVTVIESNALIPNPSRWDGVLYQPVIEKQLFDKVHIQAIPFFAWDNRQPGKMAVWIFEKN